MIATDNTTVVAYINKQGGTHSHLLLRLVVDLFLWLQDITLRARHIPCCLNVIADRLFRPNQPIITEWTLHPEVVNLIFRLWGGDTHRPLVAITTVVSTPARIECGSPATILSVPQRPFVTTGLYLKRQVIPSARMEALMQHYQAAGFSREVSKFATAPTCRRPSTSRMYDDRWLRFTTWGRGRGLIRLSRVTVPV